MLRVLQVSTAEKETTDALVFPKDSSRTPVWRPLYRQSLVGKFPPTTVEIASENPPSDYFSSGGFQIVSELLKKHINQFGVHAEYFPVDAFQGELPITKQFFFANFLEEVECLDEANGEYVYKPNDPQKWIERIQVMVIDETKTAGHHLFFVSRLSGPVFLVSQELQDSIRRQGFTGIDFIDPRNWR